MTTRIWAFLLVLIAAIQIGCSGGAGAGMPSSSPTSSSSQGSNSPVIVSVFPNPANQGETVTVVGVNFVSGLKLYTGDLSCPAIPYNFVSSTQITFAAQQCLIGPVPLTVMNPDGKISNAVNFESKTALSVTCGDPSTRRYLGTVGGGTFGCLGNFHDGVAFFVNGVATTTSQFMPSTHLHVTPSVSITAPPLPVGIYDLKVVDTDGRTQTLSAAIEYGDPPTVTSITPTSGTFVGGTTVTITGTNFSARPGYGVGVQFMNHAGGLLCPTELTIDSFTPTQIVGRTAFQASCGPGTADVTVRTPFGTASAPQQFTFTP